jgi:NADPH:quinone reductase-like Zn-dependent oxidoreductase
MRNVAICGSDVAAMLPYNKTLTTIEIDGVPVLCGLIPTGEPDFDRKVPENRSRVLVRVRAFSCNYRDKGLIFRTVTKGSGRAFYVIGSEFTGEVLDIGSGVTSLAIGDRVIADNHYAGKGWLADGVPEGLPTNQASREYQVLHEAKLAKIPSAMPDEVAAAFSIGAQTVYSMIRKLKVAEGANVLVTAAKSHTSLFAINALRKHGVNLYATTTSPQFAQELEGLGVREVILIDPEGGSFAQHDGLQRIVRDGGPFDCVFDPFFDVHLGRVVDVMAPGGRYVTCGLAEQYQDLIGQEFRHQDRTLSEVVLTALINNLHIIGNCIGLTSDLHDALRDYAAGSFGVTIDSVFRGDQVGAFFQRTYSDRDRFGKVVYQYE